MTEARGSTIALPAVVDIDALEVVREVLLDALEKGAVTLRADAVERVSTNALLMLVSAAETARRNGFPFTVEAASAPLRLAVGRLGLGPHLAGVLKG